MKKRVTKDFETRSQCELKKAGAYKYSLDPSTRPTCLAFKVLGEPTVYFLDYFMINTPWRELPPKLQTLWCRYIAEDYQFSAHNSFFERCIYDNILVARYGWPKIKPRMRRCTAAKAAACALPRKLEGAGEAMKLRVQKDKRGYVAMMRTCKPTKEWNAWKKLQDDVKAGKRITEKRRLKSLEPEPPMFLEPLPLDEIDRVMKLGPSHPLYARAETWNTLYRYCKIDVRSEEALDESLPDLIPAEQEIWHLNQVLNWRGLHIDIPTVQKVVGIMEVENKKKLKELDILTLGLVTKPGARKSILEFLEIEGITLPDLKKKTVGDALNGFDLSENMQKLLEIRKALSMTSTRKYQSFLNRAMPDNRVRDILLYHGASTGRDTGTGIMPHNFPRGLIKMPPGKPYQAVDDVVECAPDLLKLLYGEDSLPILFSAILRNMIVPSPGHELFVADFSKIEVAVLWWLADNKPGLKVLTDGLDPYKYMAAANTDQDYDDIPDDSDDRQLGKAQVLGCGFGMGAPKFQTTAWDMYRLKLTIEQAKHAVASYREVNYAVPELWKAYERAAIDAIKTGDVRYAGMCEFFVKDKFLWVGLPSGRCLAYRDPEITMRMREYEVEETNKKTGEKKMVTKISGPYETLEFWAVNSKTKKWAQERTWGGTLTENIVQATARDLMMPAMVRLEKSGYKSVLMVHDEGISEKPKGEGNIDEFVKILCAKPQWAKGLSLEAKGWKGPRYRK